MSWIRGRAPRALPLQQRLHHDPPPRAAQVDPENGEERLRAWSQQAPFSDSDLFEQRLDDGGLTRDQLRLLLAQTSWSEPDPAHTPDWVKILTEAFAADQTTPPLALPEQWRAFPGADFWPFVEPLLRRARHCLLEELEARLPSGPLRREALSDLVESCLPDKVIDWPLRMLAFELNVARIRRQLRGKTGEERFRDFTAGLDEPSVPLVILADYPVLAAQLVDHAETWREIVLEVLERLCRDWPNLVAAFDLAEDETLENLRLGAGDRHQGGRTVAILGFASGLRLVYKPRSLALDHGFQALLARLNDWGAVPFFQPLRVLDRSSHGWAEFVDHQPCTSIDQIQSFYRRQGGFLALLYALRATDIHFDNVIACGEHPMIIDLESLLQPGPIVDDPLANDPLLRSVVHVGLLPVRSWESEDSPGLDVSGLGGPGGQVTPRPDPSRAKRGTDEMHLSRRLRQIEPVTRHRPQLGDTFPPVTDHLDDLICGFRDVYDLLGAHRDVLLAEDGPVAEMLDQPVRVILRPTAVYTLMLRESFHPDFLRDGLDRDRFFDKLWKPVPMRPFLRRLIPAEQEALWQRDVPLFSCHPRSCDLRTPSGTLLQSFFAESAETMFRRRLQGFGEQDRAQQEWFIRASISILSQSNPEHEKTSTLAVHSTPVVAPEREDLLLQVHSLATALLEHRILDDDEVRWLGLLPTRQGAIKISTLGPDLYSGQAGITLFLAYLGAVTERGDLTDLAQRSCTTLLADLDTEPSPGRTDSLGLGAYSGLPGSVYVLHHLSTLWQRPALLQQGLELTAQLPALIEQDSVFDVVNGSAGCILALGSLYRDLRTSDPKAAERLLQTLTACGDHLLASAIEQEQGLGWMTSNEAEVPLTGFSHGTAGIAVALLQVADLTDRDDFRQAAEAALAYERALFLPSQGNWPDLRSKAGSDPLNWCHGAPGIGISRLLWLRLRNDPSVRQEVQTAVETTVDRGFGRNHCLCHGDLGNLDVLLCAQAALPDLDLQPAIERVTSSLLGGRDSIAWRCGLPMGVETPGLMVGLAGIGYGLLRLAAADRVPSILCLDPPVRP